MEINNKTDDIEQEVDTTITSLRGVACCKKQCIKRLLDEKEVALRLFLEEWFRLDKKQKEALLQFTIRIHSHWTPKTARCTVRKLNRFEFSDPILGYLCRKSYARILGIGEVTLARYVASVHQSKGRFSPHIHESIGKEGHHQLDPNVRSSVINFFLEIASQAGEESAGRHSRRNEENGPDAEQEVSIIFIPSRYSLRLLYQLYENKLLQNGYAKKYFISWRSCCRIFNSPELSWLRIRSPRDDMCSDCLLYRSKIANLLKPEETKTTLETLGNISSEFAKHRDLAIITREIYQKECKKASRGAEKISRYIEQNENIEKINKVLSKYEAHYSFDFSQSLWLPQITDTPGSFYFLSLRSVNLFGIVDDGGTGNPIQTNFLYDQTTASKGSSEVISMLYLFLTKRNPLAANRKAGFHADNCTAQNKNNALIQFFVWCIAMKLFDHIELKFMLKGHTKGSNDSGFGLIKKQYRRSNAYTITQIAESIQNSTLKTKRNSAIVLEKHDFGNWKLALEYFFNPLKGITLNEEFVFDKEYSLGEVHVQKYGDKKFETVNLLKTIIDSSNLLKNDKFTMLPTLLDSLEQPPMSVKKQWDLYEKVRPFVPNEYQDILCPLPNIDKE